MITLLGIDSRIQHDEFGNVVSINLKSNGYTVTFHEQSVKILKFDAPLTIIEAVDPDSDLAS